MAETYTPLATSENVVAALGRALTASEQQGVDAKLAKASELFRDAARRTFTPGRRTMRLKIHGDEVRLPEIPVVTVHTVTDDAGAAVGYSLFENVLTVAHCSQAFVRVDYSFGSVTVPELAKTTVAEMVARTYDVDKRARAGMTQFQQTAGPFQEGGTFAAWAVGGQVLLSPADAAAAQSFRPPRLPSTVVLRGR
ncbi:hypothetical protein [Microbacterium allomyrinae]|uniref:Uncharacterized protein n=1 Tax=Microbacterium allomyrinae TaxID=2830666 RepID=A0A9X1S1N8_9MICO|nr:hypothetical protein [Microbacterium allomyrinae]MCC2031826.1 hypothetical protein [Microbacterium allomyrinae]